MPAAINSHNIPSDSNSLARQADYSLEHGALVEELYATWDTPLRYRPSDRLLASDQSFMVGDSRAMSTDSRPSEPWQASRYAPE